MRASCHLLCVRAATSYGTLPRPRRVSRICVLCPPVLAAQKPRQGDAGVLPDVYERRAGPGLRIHRSERPRVAGGHGVDSARCRRSSPSRGRLGLSERCDRERIPRGDTDPSRLRGPSGGFESQSRQGSSVVPQIPWSGEGRAHPSAVRQDRASASCELTARFATVRALRAAIGEPIRCCEAATGDLRKKRRSPAPFVERSSMVGSGVCHRPESTAGVALDSWRS